MQTQTPAFILSYIKHGETSAIIRFFTKEAGFKTLIWKGVFTSKNKKKGILFPFNQVEINFKDSGFEQLDVLKNIEILHSYQLTNLSIEKNTLLLFLSEVLNNALKNEQENQQMYHFLEAEINQFITQDNTQNFSAEFLIKLSSLLGFSAHQNHEIGYYFDFSLGEFVENPGINYLSLEDSVLWKEFLENPNKKLQAAERVKILSSILDFYAAQITHFRKPKSFEIIKEIFS